MRIRTVKPEFWQSEQIAKLKREVRMLAIALLNLSDDEGYFRSAPALIAGAVLPFDDDGQAFVSKALPQLEAAHFVKLHPGAIGHVVKFKDHQRINRPSPSRLKDKIHGALTEYSVSPHGVLSESSLLEVEVEQGSGTGNREVEQGEMVFDHWRAVFDKQKAKFDDKRKRAVKARLAEGRSVDDLKQAIDGCSKTPHNMGQNDRGEKYTDLELICRDGPHVERFMANALSPPKPQPSKQSSFAAADAEYDHVPGEIKI